MYSAYTLNKQDDNIQPWCTPFPILKQSVVPCKDLTAASWPTHRFLRGQIRWSGIPISFRIFHSLLWSQCQRLNCSQWSRSRCCSEIPLFFSMIQWMLAIWSLAPLPFLNPASTVGSSWFTHSWNVAWRILSIILLACETKNSTVVCTFFGTDLLWD